MYRILFCILLLGAISAPRALAADDKSPGDRPAGVSEKLWNLLVEIDAVAIL